MSNKYYKSVDDTHPSAPSAPHVIPSDSVVLSFDAPPPIVHQSHPDSNENEEEKVCRCCHGTDPVSDLIAPCACAGSIKYVHRSCLDHWRCVSSNPESFYQCDICKQRYVFREKVKSADETLLKFKFAVLVLLDFTMVAVGWQLLVLVCMLVSYLAESVANIPLRSIYPDNWPPGLAFYVSGHLLFLFCLGVIGILLGTIKLLQAIFNCGGSHSENQDYEYAYDSYPYYRSFWAWDFWIYWNIMYFNPWYSYGHYPGFYLCFTPLNFHGTCCECGNFGSCNLDCNGGGDSGAGVLVTILAIAVIVVILIGVVVGVLFLIQIGTVILTRRLSLLKKKHELVDYEVEDLQNRV